MKSFQQSNQHCFYIEFGSGLWNHTSASCSSFDMSRNDVQGQCGSTFSIVLLYQWAQVRPYGVFHHNAESLFSIYLSSLSSHAIHLVFSTSPSFSSEWLRYDYTRLSFPDMPLTTKCWCRPSQRCVFWYILAYWYC